MKDEQSRALALVQAGALVVLAATRSARSSFVNRD
jgi:hypothetical protein